MHGTRATRETGDLKYIVNCLKDWEMAGGTMTYPRRENEILISLECPRRERAHGGLWPVGRGPLRTVDG